MFAELSLCLYDIAAAKVILEEAGGKMTGWKGESDAVVTGNVAATNGVLHDFLLGYAAVTAYITIYLQTALLTYTRICDIIFLER